MTTDPPPPDDGPALDAAWERLHRALLLERYGPLRPELPEHVRAAKRAADRRFWRELKELHTERARTGAVVPLPKRSA